MRNKRKGIMMAAAILGSAAIISTGFAAWVVTIENSDTATGNISVDTLKDTSITVEVLETNKDADVKFGAAARDDKIAKNQWLTPTPEEDLVASFTIKVTGASHLDVSSTTSAFTFTLAEQAESTLYKNAADAGYVKALDKTSVTYAEVTDHGLTLVSDQKIYKVTITFAWGAYFENVNPTNFYNKYLSTTKLSETDSSGNDGDDKDQTLLANAQEVLAGPSAYTALSEAKFNLTIAPVRKSA